MEQPPALPYATAVDRDLVVRPEVWRAPGALAVMVLLAQLFGITLFILFTLWVEFQCCSLTVGRDRLTFRRGVFSRRTREMRLRDVRAVDVEQGLLQRIVRSGTVRVSSAASAGAVVAIPCVACWDVKAEIERRVGG